MNISVLVACHPPYVKFLKDCLESILTQKGTKEIPLGIDIFVGFDGDRTKAHEFVKICQELKFPFNRIFVPGTPFYNVCKLRNWLAAKSNPDAFLFVDADNTIGPDYIRFMVEALESNVYATVAYPWIRIYDNETNATLKNSPPPMFRWETLIVSNYIESCSLIKAEIFREFNGWDESVHGYMDWDLWVRMLRPDTGYIGVPSKRSVLNYREHGKNMSVLSRKNLWPHEIRERQAAKAVFIPFSGRKYCLDIPFRFLNSLEYDKKELALYLYDNSPKKSESSSRLIQRYASRAMRDWGRVTYFRDIASLGELLPEQFKDFSDEDNSEIFSHDKGKKRRDLLGRFIAIRMAKIYNWMLHNVREDRVLIVEDDNEPEPDVIDKLTNPFSNGDIDIAASLAACISGWYMDRYRDMPVLANEVSRYPLMLTPVYPPKAGEVDRKIIEQIDMSGFGTSLMFLPCIRLANIHFRAWPEEAGAPVFGCDPSFGYDIKSVGWIHQYVHWGVRSKHWISEKEWR